MKHKFYLHCKRLFLTYKHCKELNNKSIIHDYFITFFKHNKKARIITLITAHEYSDNDHTYEHYHVFIELDRQIKIYDPTMLDIHGIHGQYESVRNTSKTIKYTMKDNDVLIHGYTMSLQDKCKNSLEQITTYLAKTIYMYKTSSLYKELHTSSYMQLLAKAINSMEESDRAKFAINSNRLKQAVYSYISYEHPTLFKTRIMPLKSFNIPQEVIEWINKHKHELTLILTGPTGLGKTEFAKSLFNNPLLISHMDQLKYLSSYNDGVIFDDMNFNKSSTEECIHITDVSNTRAVNVKNDISVIPEKLPRVITTNKQYKDLFPNDKHSAIRRRCIVFITVNPLYKEDKD